MLRNGYKEGNIGNVSNLNMDDPFKKLQKTTGFFLTEKRILSVSKEGSTHSDVSPEISVSKCDLPLQIRN